MYKDCHCFLNILLTDFAYATMHKCVF